MELKRIGVLTSGGDSPGMNPAIRAVVRSAIAQNCQVVGIYRGFRGVLEKLFEEMDARSVGGIIGRGGTILETSRSKEFMLPEGREMALSNLREAGIQGLVIIGGNGSLTGALELHKLGMPVVGLPGSIDNDLKGTDMAIGVDTCLNTIQHAVDNIRDTASSHHRAFIIEVMGRNCGYLALMSALNCGAEVVLTPENEPDLEEVRGILSRYRERNKSHFIVVLAEGAKIKAHQLAKFLESDNPAQHYEPRITILGHVQRGGSPTAFDRNLATRLGAAAVTVLLQGRSGVMIGLVNGHLHETPLQEAVGELRKPDMHLFDLHKMMTQ
ncbi:MAG: 6-phosphofructokinase [Chloroflexota bacterium]|nr:6-phosphofructokinase [Chloroflexota bacterium]